MTVAGEAGGPPGAQRALGVLALLVTALGWGLGWVSTKIVLQVWPPLFARGTAGIIAALLLALVAWQRRESLKVPREAIPRLLVAAFTNVFAWMGFSALCLKWLNIGQGALLVFTMPIWATLLAWPVQGTRPTLKGFAALALGLVGVTILVSGNDLSLSGGQLPGIACAVGAALLFALGAVLNRRPIPVPPVALIAWQVGLGCIPMVAIGLLFEHPHIAALDGPAFWAMAYMVILPMAVCYLTWFAALKRLPPGSASTAMLLVPLTGTMSAALFLGEPLGLREMLAMAFVLGGVVLALRK
ncbi:transporter [Azorhizobium oxalatiphilum]|uniref:Transporter n=2 Tax=Azorhizobium oxalatiphilum TaxID=980631 RepID=A0A917FHY3_9HYPH|nr:transporter [Azorhizobium oxalatiphilum]